MKKINEFISELKSLDPKYIYNWPWAFKILIFFVIFALVVAIGGFLLIQPQLDDLDAAQVEEKKLKDDYVDKKKQAINLPLFKQQLVDVETAFGELLKQLPNSAQVSSLLVDINSAGISRGLQFELFKPKQEKMSDFYAELPIEIKVTGNYTDIGNFVSDISRLPRIVMMSDVKIKYDTKKTGAKSSKEAVAESIDQLTFESTAKTFRYLDQEEMEKIRKDKEKERAKKAGKGKAPAKAAPAKDGGKK